jgi:hypothetical protein
MVFSDIASLAALSLTPDGDTYLAIPAVGGPYYSTPFGVRLAQLLQRFSVDTMMCFAAMQAVTVPSGVNTLDFSNSSVCTLNFHYVTRLWLNNTLVERYESVADVLSNFTPSTPAGLPACYCQLDPQTLIFDVTTDISVTSAYAQGYYRHPVITADTTPVLMAPEWLDLFNRYAQVYLRQDVVGDDIGLQRLQRIDSQAFDAISRIKSDRMRDLLSREPRRNY